MADGEKTDYTLTDGGVLIDDFVASADSSTVLLESRSPTTHIIILLKSPKSINNGDAHQGFTLNLKIATVFRMCMVYHIRQLWRYGLSDALKTLVQEFAGLLQRCAGRNN